MRTRIWLTILGVAIAIAYYWFMVTWTPPLVMD